MEILEIHTCIIRYHSQNSFENVLQTQQTNFLLCSTKLYSVFRLYRPTSFLTSPCRFYYYYILFFHTLQSQAEHSPHKA